MLKLNLNGEGNFKQSLDKLKEEKLEKYFDDKFGNPDPATKEDIRRIEEKLDYITSKLNLLFGDSVIIDGMWVDLRG